MKNSIIYTITDEAPALATASFLPIVKKMASEAGVTIETRDISLSARILALFPDFLLQAQRQSDDLAELGELVKTPEANVIKLPNISASVPQLTAAIKELQQQGYALPDYPDQPSTDKEKDIRARYDRVKGSAVNPVLREGNSDRRAPGAVKKFAQSHPHSMGKWSKDSLSHVSSMTGGDFYGSEKSIILDKADDFSIIWKGSDGSEKILRDKAPLQKGEVLDAAVLSIKTLQDFYREQIKDAQERDVLLSIHLKATMMKVSDPILFGQILQVFFADLFEKYGELFQDLEIDANNGLGDLIAKLEGSDKKEEVLADLKAALDSGPDLAMVDSDRGITNFHVPSDIIIDASMPAAIRNSGQMWGPDGKPRDTKYIIPDRSYAGVYQAAIDFCRENGALDPSSLGSVANVGLMAQKAEEYGSHDKTFLAPGEGVIQAVNSQGNVLLEQSVQKQDLFRMCQVKDAPIQNWVSLAVERARRTGSTAIFWLDPQRAHDRCLISLVEKYLKNEDTSGLEILIKSPVEATRYSFEQISKGIDVISVTGNVLRDYLTDLFPILEVGTSAKMLSIVPLMEGGGLFETGAGGSAPKHVQQLLKENHLRWDSLGEYLALAVSLEHLAHKEGNKKAEILGRTLDLATGKYLEENRSPSRKVGEPDNRSCHYFLFQYWARALASQQEDLKMSKRFSPLADELEEKEKTIIHEFLECQGKAIDLKGYYKTQSDITAQVMQPSQTMNSILDRF